MCETIPSTWNDPASAADPKLATAQGTALTHRVDELERGAVTIHELHARMLEMCSMCRGAVCDVPDGTTKEAVKDRIRFLVEKLRTARASQPTPRAA